MDEIENLRALLTQSVEAIHFERDICMDPLAPPMSEEEREAPLPPDDVVDAMLQEADDEYEALISAILVTARSTNPNSAHMRRLLRQAFVSVELALAWSVEFMDSEQSTAFVERSKTDVLKYARLAHQIRKALGMRMR